MYSRDQIFPTLNVLKRTRFLTNVPAISSRGWINSRQQMLVHYPKSNTIDLNMDFEEQMQFTMIGWSLNYIFTYKLLQPASAKLLSRSTQSYSELAWHQNFNCVLPKIENQRVKNSKMFTGITSHMGSMLVTRNECKKT